MTREALYRDANAIAKSWVLSPISASTTNPTENRKAVIFSPIKKSETQCEFFHTEGLANWHVTNRKARRISTSVLTLRFLTTPLQTVTS